MMKENKWKMILSTILTLLPAVTGSVVPLFLCVVHLFCIYVTIRDPKNKEQTKKVVGMIFWICPVLSIYVTAINHAVTAGMEFGVDVITLLMIGIMFVVIGNYLPKCKQNYTIGIKIPWTYTSEENWNRTHRFGGKVWVIGGMLLTLSVFLPEERKAVVMIAAILGLTMIPMVYSYLFYRKERAEGRALPPSVVLGNSGRLAGLFTVGIFIFVGIMMFTGNIEFRFEKDAMVIEASYWDDMTVEYEKIEKIEYREEGVSGSRANGFGSPRLLMGTFENEEFGYYTRYSYTKADSAIVLTLPTRELVISEKNDESTMELYRELLVKMDSMQNAVHMQDVRKDRFETERVHYIVKK